MRIGKLFYGVIGVAVITMGLAMAQDGNAKRKPARAGAGEEPRAHGVFQHGTEHHTVRGGGVVHSPVYHEPRSIGDIRRDPHLVRFDHQGWHAVGHWDHWYR